MAKSAEAVAAAAADSPRKSDVTRRRIIEAAAREFREKGYAAARLSDIAARIGMKAGSLYYHFESRETLVEAVMEAGLSRTEARVRERLAGLPENVSHVARIEAAISAHLETVLEQGDVASATIMLFAQVPPDIRARQLVRQRAYGAIWRRLLDDARRAGEIRDDVDLSAIRMAIMGALNWAADWYRPGRTGPRNIARDIAAVVLNGLSATHIGLSPRDTRQE